MFWSYQWKCQRSVYACACARARMYAHTLARTHLPQFFKKLVRYCGSAFFFFFFPLFPLWLDKPLDFLCPFVLYLHFLVLGAKALSGLQESLCPALWQKAVIHTRASVLPCRCASVQTCRGKDLVRFKQIFQYLQYGQELRAGGSWADEVYQRCLPKSNV